MPITVHKVNAYAECASYLSSYTHQCYGLYLPPKSGAQSLSTWSARGIFLTWPYL